MDVVKALEAQEIDYCIVGGYALALHGVVRATVDVDLVLRLNLPQFEAAEKVLLDLGLRSRIPVRAQDIISMRKEYIENRNLIAWSFVDFGNPMRQLDILITHSFEDLKVVSLSFSGIKIKVASIEDLIQMKALAGRPQDLLDIDSLKKVLREKNKKA